MKRTIYILIITLTLALFIVSCANDNQEEADDQSTIGDTSGQDVASDTSTEKTTGDNTAVKDQSFDESEGFTDENGCYDSEGGVFYDKKGYVIDAKGSRYEDECLNLISLSDVYCGIVGYKDDQTVNCEFECKDGACIEGDVSPLKCDDSDFKDYENKGSVTYKEEVSKDYCKNTKYLIEQVCTSVGIPFEEEKYCKYGCLDGACIKAPEQEESSCIDSDFGAEAQFTKGSVTDPKGVVEDECLNSKTVKEYRCNSVGFRAYNNLECENSCVDGACVR